MLNLFRGTKIAKAAYLQSLADAERVRLLVEELNQWAPGTRAAPQPGDGPERWS